ncbi:uncharacterized protein LOC107477415 [Arachis duranensis]|uniref:Uncharacterized protein LOC107477415 n=1 Tax=Arachis duranensis TaxID=130453 RepID=A0A6P5N4N1_ARADU|nr:uncharacterized protein LOC107477415 [Arachis duranensis]
MNTLPLRRDALDNIIGTGGDINCIWELRMSLNTFANLCELLQVQGGLDKDGHVGISEQVATFLIILAHHTKNCSVQVRFYRSSKTISRYFHKVLGSVLRVQSVLFAKADHVQEDCIDSKWKWFKGYLGVLDGTYIDVTVPKGDKSRYHVNEWTQGHRASQNRLELFNKKHSSTRNVIERCFGLLKKRWMNMDVDLQEDATLLLEHIPIGDDTIVDEADIIDVVKSSHEWTQWRENFATEM